MTRNLRQEARNRRVAMLPQNIRDFDVAWVKHDIRKHSLEDTLLRIGKYTTGKYFMSSNSIVFYKPHDATAFALGK